MSQIVVIGAGIAGLTAAYRLQKAGHSVIVLEAADHVGGRMITIEWNGWKIDPGAKFVTGGDKYLLEMVADLGLQNHLYSMYSDGVPTVILRDGQMHAVNFVSIGSYLRWTGVSRKARLAMVKLIPYFIKTALQIKHMYRMEQVPGPDGETLEEFFRRHISAEMYEYWAFPTFETYCSYGPGDISRKAFLSLLMSYLNTKSLGLRPGIGVLPEALASRLDVRLKTAAKRLEFTADGVRVLYDQAGKQEQLAADLAVVAVPGDQVPDLVAAPRPAWQDFFPFVHYSETVSIFPQVEGDFDPGGPGVMIPRSEGMYICSIGVDQKRPGQTLLLVDASVAQYDPAESDEAIIRKSKADVEKIYPELAGRLGDTLVYRWPRKVPTFRPGYLEALARFRADMQEHPVYFCGDYFSGPSTGAALYSGWECADRILSRQR
ncbi:MAG: NAD(P)/FAD-dependent oxidoreductase [Anaerolineales bacterium]